MFDKFFHKFLSVPHRLYMQTTRKRGDVVLLLHGVASDLHTWDYLVPLLDDKKRVAVVDLLGFGKSPKPQWSNYTVKDHAESVARSIRELRPRKPITIVGHSMGALVAIEVAKRYPHYVRQLILCGMPLYESLDQKPRKIRPHVQLYETLVKYQKFTLLLSDKINKYLGSSTHFVLSEETWLPFERSLTNTILEQSALTSLQAINVPTTIIYGTKDMLINKTHLKQLQQLPHVRVEAFNGRHEITPVFASVIAEKLND